MFPPHGQQPGAVLQGWLYESNPKHTHVCVSVQRKGGTEIERYPYCDRTASSQRHEKWVATGLLLLSVYWIAGLFITIFLSLMRFPGIMETLPVSPVLSEIFLGWPWEPAGSSNCFCVITDWEQHAASTHFSILGRGSHSPESPGRCWEVKVSESSFLAKTLL